MTKLLLSRAVLKRDPSADAELNSGSWTQSLAAFTLRDEETNEITRIVGLDMQMLGDMGDPTEITIAVQGGIHLNDPTAPADYRASS